MVGVCQDCVLQSGRFAFSKIQNSTFSKLCPPSKRKLLMGNFSERLWHKMKFTSLISTSPCSLRNENYNASLNHRHDTSSDKWPWSAVILYPYWHQSITAIVRHRLEDYCGFFLVLKARRQRSSSIDQIWISKQKANAVNLTPNSKNIN